MSLRVALVVVTAVAAALVGASPASASCALRVTVNDVPHVSVAPLDAHDVGPVAGPGVVPPCDDVVGTPGEGPQGPQTVNVHTVVGVAPRFGLALNGALVVPPDGPCRRAAQRLPCLRSATRAFRRGPSLVVPVSAPAGSNLDITVNVRSRALRRLTVEG